MPLQLLEFDVFKAVELVSPFRENYEIDMPVVPVNEVWRVDRIAAGVIIAEGRVAQQSQPVLFLYDNPDPGPSSMPMDTTVLSTYPTVNFNGVEPAIGIAGDYWFDFDDTGAPYTLQAGNALALVFALGVATESQYIALARVQYSRFSGSAAGPPTPYAGGEPAPTIPPGI